MAIPVQLLIQLDAAKPELARLQGSPIEAFLYDLSEYGIGLISNVSLPWGTLVDLTFSRSSLPLANHAPLRGLMHITGRVVHAIPHAGQYRLGISFTRMEEADRALIREMIFPRSVQPEERRRAPRLLLSTEAPRSI